MTGPVPSGLAGAPRGSLGERPGLVRMAIHAEGGRENERLVVVAQHVVDRRLMGGRPLRELWRRRVL